MALAQDEDMVETLAPDRADKPFHEGILPRTLGDREDFMGPHASHSLPDGLAVNLIAIAEEIGRCRVFGEGLYDLLGGPGSGGMLSHVEVEDATAVVGEDDQDEEEPH
jgi:hypothetical protein